MKKYLYVATLVGLVSFCGCGALKEFIKTVPGALKDASEETGSPPPIGTTGTPLDYAPLASYLLNLGLATWGAYERRERLKK